MGHPGQANEMSPQPMLAMEPFKRWELYFSGPFNPPSSQKAYIRVATNYVTKWVEVVALPRAMKETVINFLFELFV